MPPDSTVPGHKSYTYIVEHLDPELEAWSALEYGCIARETSASGSVFLLSSVPASLALPASLQSLVTRNQLRIEQRSVEHLFDGREGRPGKDAVCLLDPKAARELEPSDAQLFDAFLFGGILGDDPPRDRTAELRQKGYPTRRLGPVQMTTDTAVRVTRMIVQEGMKLDEVPYVDFPELRINRNESTQMPFRYVKDQETGEPVMPDGMRDLIVKDSEKGFGELL